MGPSGKGPEGLAWAQRPVGRPRGDPSHTCRPKQHSYDTHTPSTRVPHTRHTHAAAWGGPSSRPPR